jgi:hypothetical protein
MAEPALEAVGVERAAATDLHGRGQAGLDVQLDPGLGPSQADGGVPGLEGQRRGLEGLGGGPQPVGGRRPGQPRQLDPADPDPTPDLPGRRHLLGHYQPGDQHQHEHPGQHRPWHPAQR